MRPLLLSALAAALLSAPACAAPDAAVREAERQRAAAVAKADIGSLRKLIGGEYYHVESNGRVFTKTEFLQALGRDDFKLTDYGIDDMEVSVLGSGEAAVVTGRFHVRMLTQNTLRQFRGRYVRVWILQPEGWRNTLHQSTEIRPAGTPATEPRPLPRQ